MKKIIACLSCPLLLIMTNAGAQFRDAAKGIQYQVISTGEGKKVAQGEYMEIHVRQVYEANGTDSVLYDSRSKATQIFPFDSAGIPAVFYNIFSEVRKGDSVILKQLTDSVMGNEGELPPFIKKGNFITGHYKIVNIYDTKESAAKAYEDQKKAAMARDSAAAAVQIEKDNAIIEAYLAGKNIKTIKAPQGTYVQIIKQGTGPIAAKGKTIKIFYTGRTIPGEKVFDSNTDTAFQHATVFDFKMHTEGEAQSVITGLEDGISLLKKGAVAKLFIPSVLAYGKVGVGEEIGPDQNLCFDIKVTDVVTDAPATAPIKKKNSKKQPAKKKVKK